MSAVLVASITQLCAADHKNNAEALASWLANKSPEDVARWFEAPGLTMLVAESNGEIAGVGAYGADRVIRLNYVSPHHRHKGVSKAMLAAMEAALGPGEARLDSTQTALPFYRAAGWREHGPLEPYGFVPGQPMRKVLG